MKNIIFVFRKKKPRKVKVIAKALAVTFFLLPLPYYTYIHGSYFFWLMNASAGGKALPPAFFLCKIWNYKKRFVFLRKRCKVCTQ